MKAFISGTLSTPQKTFHLTDLWFANEKAEDTDRPSLNCIGLSATEGFDCETVVSPNGLAFTSRWKGVYLNDVDEEGMEYRTELFSIEQFHLMLKNGHMKLANASAFIDSDVYVTIREIYLVNGEESLLLSEFIDDDMPIEFFA